MSQQPMSKAALARHLVNVRHGESVSLVPLQELRSWRREELNAEHERLLDAGPCPSFRESMVKKAVGE